MTKHIEQALVKLKGRLDEVKSDLDKSDGMITVNQERLKKDFKLNTLKAAKDKIGNLNQREEDMSLEANAQFKELKKEVDF